MAFDDAVADRQAQPGAVADVFGGEEWIEDLGQVLLADARARVRESDLDGVLSFPVTGADVQVAAALHGFCGVDDHVDEDALDLRRIDHRQGQVFLEMLDHFDVMEERLVLHQGDTFVQHFVDIAEGLVRLALAGEVQQPADDVSAAVSLSDDLFQRIYMVGIIAFKIFQ